MRDDERKDRFVVVIVVLFILAAALLAVLFLFSTHSPDNFPAMQFSAYRLRPMLDFRASRSGAI
jgi:hypothetical protein